MAAQIDGYRDVLPIRQETVLQRGIDRTGASRQGRRAVILDQPQKAQANIEAARRFDSGIRIKPKVLRAARTRAAPGTEP